MIPATLKKNKILNASISELYALKAEDLVLIDIRKIPTITDDFIIVCTCQSEVQMQSIIRKMGRLLKEKKLPHIKTEYSPGVKWGILDCGEFVLHVFEEGTRAYYSLERLWRDSPQYELAAEDFGLSDSELKESESNLATGEGADEYL